jgi:hypothetical protein
VSAGCISMAIQASKQDDLHRSWARHIPALFLTFVLAAMPAFTTGSTVIDVGANIGSFARVAAAAAGPGGHVLCMEPLPQLQRALGLNLTAFQQWAAQRGQKVARTTIIAAGMYILLLLLHGVGHTPCATANDALLQDGLTNRLLGMDAYVC